MALYLNGMIIERYEVAPRNHTRLLLPQIDSLLKEANLLLSDLDAFAFGCGPGSFTGVRIACSIIQALGFALNKPIVPVSTLRSLAQAAHREQGISQVFASLSAGLQEIYWGLFAVDAAGIMQAVGKEHIQLSTDIELPPGHWHSVSGYPRAHDIAVIAQAEFRLGHTVTAENALPVYLREDVFKKS